MPVPFRPLSPDSNHLQGPQDAMKAIYKQHPTAFLLPIIKDAPLSVKLPSDISVVDSAEWKVTECFSNAGFHETLHSLCVKPSIFKHIITLHIKLTTQSGISTPASVTESRILRATLENQLANDLRKLAHAIRFGHLSALKHLICHLDRSSCLHHDADPIQLHIKRSCVFRLGKILELYHGFEVVYGDEGDYYLVVARKHPPVFWE
ncbi:MAG: hypothetical protein Q9161_002036 [Pseudevernia consocians]